MYEQEIYKLKLHEKVDIEGVCTVLRVPGGCIYTIYGRAAPWPCMFVPFSKL